jgi:hypothetical protein
VTKHVASYLQDASAVLDYRIDWSAFIEDDPIIASTWTVDPAGLATSLPSFTTSTTTVWLSGGVKGEFYTITNHITTQGGRQDSRYIVVGVI